MERRADFLQEHRCLLRSLEEAGFEEFRQELLRHLRREERVVFDRLRPLLDPMGPPWLERRLALEELLEAPDSRRARPLLERVLRLEEEQLFPLARALKILP